MSAATRFVVALATQRRQYSGGRPGPGVDANGRPHHWHRRVSEAALKFRHSDETVVRRLVRRADCPRATTTTRFASRCRAGWRSSSPARARTARGRGAAAGAASRAAWWRAVLLSSGAKVGDVVKVEADVDLEGISILHVLVGHQASDRARAARAARLAQAVRARGDNTGNEVAHRSPAASRSSAALRRRRW